MAAEAARLRTLHQAAERISASLVELELDSSRQLLAASALEGESAARWAAASDTLTELWRRRGLLEEFLERAHEAQRSKRIDELRSLLSGRSIQMVGDDVPLAQRTLLGAGASVERCSPSDLIASMSQAFDEVKDALCAFGAAWEKLLPRIEAARGVAQDCARLAGDLGEPGRADLEPAEETVKRLNHLVSSDPLSVRADEVDELIASLRATRAELEESAALKEHIDLRMLEARQLLERLSAAAREAVAAHEEALLKISQPLAPPVHPVPGELEDDLRAIDELAGRGAWREARRALGAWTARTRTLLDDVAQARAANRAPVEARDQFRALLEAYQVKAKRLGRLEDPDMAELWASAHQALYTAPTDLAVAARLVRSYQEALTGLRPSSETMR
jgi:hypothetical protein